MNKLALRKPVFLFTLLGISIVIVSAWAMGIVRPSETEANQARKEILLGNNTRSLEIIKAELSPRGRSVRVAVKNITGKNISWFRISLGADTAIEADCLMSDKTVLAPGEVYEDEYPFDSKSEQVQVTVVSVLFEDRISDGDEHYAQLLREKRSGQKMELSRLIPLLRKAGEAATPDQASSDSKNLEPEMFSDQHANNSRVGELDLRTEARLIGIRTIRDRVHHEIQQLKVLEAKDRSRDIRQELKSVNERYTKIKEHLKDYD
ncbi:MAG TPA: hypothetical protein VNO50_02600 [Pyrinomonadaceae bacterium]|nr:hypothetical protein [Pyrinomonadaceae bacterium]